MDDYEFIKTKKFEIFEKLVYIKINSTNIRGNKL